MRSNFLALILLALAPSFVLAADPAFKAGETIRYNVKQGFVKMGSATLEFTGEADLDGKKAVLIVFTAKGIGFFDEEKIYVDPVSFKPFRVLRTLDIPGEKSKIREDYFSDQDLIQVTKEQAGKTTVQKIAKKGAVDNIYGFIYRYRLTADPKSAAAFDVILPTVDVKIKKVKEVEFEVGPKVYRAALMRSVPEKYSIWFDMGEKRLPLRIAGAIGMANTVMTMVGVEEK